MKAFEERRKTPRASADFGVRFKLDGHGGSATVRDISASGVLCVTDRPLPPMTQVALVLVLPGAESRREITCRGAVVRSGPTSAKSSAKAATGFETAIFFTDLLDSDRVEIEEFVSSSRQ